MFTEIINYIVNTVSYLGYFGIVALMALESSCFPFPSEVVMIPAGYLSAKGEMNIYIVILCGIIGSILGALFNYYIALYLGKPLLIKYKKYFFINEYKIEKAEKFFLKHGAISTFIGRLIPVIRQYISLPAGFSKMPIKTFIIFTSFGAGIWMVILSLLGYFLGDNQDLINQYERQIIFFLMLFCALVLLIYIYYNNKKITR